ncbi:hypothetical protein [Methylobacterium sp. WL7]|uniref:hypothetical protein n=1 Tax=Methylobacterium sp. WL7 TaxID=2603900 RepID=UPI0011C7FDC6|nr:hypothetical protein [Methylobacterium sp. WL7]TXN42937.1 hypothetical protein FV233_20610 [Methylobacterium sp. WL7]
MLNKMLARFTPLLAQPMRPQVDEPEAADAMEAYAFLSAVAAAMPSLNPPPAANDDPMEAVHKVVEYELVHTGYLR